MAMGRSRAFDMARRWTWRSLRKRAALVLVPEAAMHKDRFAVLPHHDVRRARKLAACSR